MLADDGNQSENWYDENLLSRAVVETQNVQETNSDLVTNLEIRVLENGCRPWARQLLEAEWGGNIVVSRGRVRDASQLPGLIALDDNQPLGLVTYRIDGDAVEAGEPLVKLDTESLERAVESARQTLIIQEAADFCASRIFIRIAPLCIVNSVEWLTD